jgi:peptidoglycan/xylan/chitin deacetylase (PgdA/CDA1 family)
MSGPLMSGPLVYRPDLSLRGKLRRRWCGLHHRRRAVAPRQPLVTFAFDDGLASSLTRGAELLEMRGARGVFFIAAGLCGSSGPLGAHGDLQDVQAAAASGQEVGCHTYSHLDCSQADRLTIRRDASRNRQALAPLALTAFAYPYGDVSLAAKTELSRSYQTLRTTHAGLIDGGTDLNQLPAVGIEGPGCEARVQKWLASARSHRAWVVLFTHDVAERPSPWGTTPDTLARAIDLAMNSGCKIVTMAEGLRHVTLETGTTRLDSGGGPR